MPDRRARPGRVAPRAVDDEALSQEILDTVRQALPSAAGPTPDTAR